MSVATTGIDPERAASLDAKTAELEPVSTPDDEAPTAPDQFDPQYTTTRKEIWAYYAYYVGNNGLTLFNFAPTAFQNLLYIAAGDSETLHFLGHDRSINSIVLLANGISFAIQVCLFLILGSFADYGSWRPNILIFWSIVAFALGFGWLGVHTSDKWHVATGLYMIGLIAYQMCITFWTAAFPGLARNTPELREKAEMLQNGEIDREKYDFADMMQRNRISNVAFIVQSAGEVLILAVIVGIMFGVNVNASQDNNNWGLSVLIAFASGVWLLLTIPWFTIEKRRPGQDLPPNMNIVSVGFWSLWRAIRQIWRLKQSLLYLIGKLFFHIPLRRIANPPKATFLKHPSFPIRNQFASTTIHSFHVLTYIDLFPGYFLLGDSLNTTVTVIATLQNTIVSYNTLTLTYLLIVGITAQLLGIGGFWLIQKRFSLNTKIMFDLVMLGIVLLDGWGMIGIWTQRFGFHHVWEVWLYQVFYGLFVCPWYSYSQIMISEVTPRGREFLFFSLFSIMGKTSAFVGPIVSSAIIDASHGNNSTPFYFLFGLSCASFALLAIGVDLKKSRREQEAFLEEERRVKERRASVISMDDGLGGKVREKESDSGEEKQKEGELVDKV
ncbi:MAG: hypothetical protein Q9227_005054 [Pyrenula ochraceoflavens]